MATREENLKKINDELEQLSDEELENIAGGYKDRGQVDRGQVPSINEPKEGIIRDKLLYKNPRDRLI